MLLLSNNLHMKFFGPNSLSHFLFYVSRFCALGSITLITFILISLGTGNYEIINNQFQISLPLFSETFIRADYQYPHIVTITLTMLFFSTFFYLLSNIFKTFKAATVFSHKAIKTLNYFAFLNLIVAPMLFLTIDFFIMQKQQIGNIFNYLLTFILGVFLLFIIAIFKQGYKVQSENDLTI